MLASSCPQTCSCSPPPTWLIHFPNTPHFCLPPFWKSQMPDSICALFYSWYHCLSHSANLSYCCSSYITCGLASWGSHNEVSKLSSVKGLLADVLGLWKPCSFTTTWCCLCSTKAVISSTCTIGQLARFGLYAFNGQFMLWRMDSFLISPQCFLLFQFNVLFLWSIRTEIS